MRAPGFWWARRPGWQARALAPAAALWGLVGRRRAARATPYRAPVPVVCVGNLTAGGAGKTPMVAWLVERLTAAGEAPHVLSRGHGGRLTGPHRVDPGRDGFEEVGDEPLLLAALAPVWIARDRAAGARAAAEAGASVVVMDDGYQNPSLAKDFSVLMVDAGQGFGNGMLIPAGPLREPLAQGLSRAQAVVLVGPEQAREQALARWPEIARPYLWEAELAPRRSGLDIAGERVVAFAGIGRPEKFFDTLRAMGADLIASIPFADHYPYPPEVLTRLARQARSADAMLVTTEKDAVRLPPAFRREVMTVQVALDLQRPDRLLSEISAAIAAQSAR